METKIPVKQSSPQVSKKFNAKALRLSLKFRPKIYRLILRMRLCIRQKNAEIKTLKNQLAVLNNIPNSQTSQAVANDKAEPTTKSQTTIATTDNKTNLEDETTKQPINVWGGEEGTKSIADQVKEVAQSALQQNGMVYVESAGMYYDYKSGYYYNSELGLYYHNDTGCYYCYSEDQKNFVFHSYPDRHALAANASLIAHEKRKARKQKKDKKDNKPRKAKKRKLTKKTETEDKIEDNSQTDAQTETIEKNNEDSESKTDVKEEEMEVDEVSQELEDGECSDTESEGEVGEDIEQSDASTSTVSDDESISKHHPPCMRVIVRETSLPKLKVGTLYLVTKDGGTLGREGDHTVLIRDTNISRMHLDIKYDMARRVYLITDLGSKNGTILNGQRMSESQVTSQPMEVVHGSVIQVGDSKLLCHIHPGTDTCGHCEPGLIMETEEKEKKSAYNRTCSKSKQHQLELARLKNKYAPQPLMIEETAYNDRAEARRREVGSSHSAEKTQAADLDTAISSDNKGFKLMQKMGWSQGEGLGKENQGDTDPIPLVSNEGKAGLGTSGAVGPPDMNPAPKPRNKLGPATLRLASKTKMLQPPAKAFLICDDDEEEVEN